MAERVLVGVAVAAIAATDVGYLLLIRGQGGGDADTPWVVPFVAGYLVLMAVLLAVSLFVPPSSRPAIRAGASAGLVLLGVLAFSIGVALLIAAGLAIAATVLALRARTSPGAVISAVAAGLLALVVLIGGLQIANAHVVCPATGQSGGSTGSLIGRGFSYECNDGVLTTSR